MLKCKGVSYLSRFLPLFYIMHIIVFSLALVVRSVALRVGVRNVVEVRTLARG